MPMLIEHASALATGYQDLLRASLQQLAPLSKRRGVSPVIRTLIKSAVKSVEAALADPTKRKDVESAAAALRSCVQLVQEGLTNERDQPLLDDVAAAFSLIFEALDRGSDTNPGAQVPVRGSASDLREEAKAPVPEIVATARSDDGEALGLQLTRLERLYVARAACVEDPTSTFRELRAAEERIQGREATVFHMAPSEVAWETAGMVAGAGGIRTLLGLRLKGQAREWTPAFANALAEIASASKEQQLLAVDILRMSRVDAPMADMSQAPYRVLPPEIRAALLPFAMESRRLDTPALLALLDEPMPMAEAAAGALAWCRIQNGGRLLLERALEHQPSQLSDALLFASVTQGEREALSEIRLQLAAGRATPWLIDALAVAGGSTDGDLLLDVANGGGLLGCYALFACAHLGHPGCVARIGRIGSIGSLDNALDPSLIERALALMTAGDGAATSASIRLVHGRPWSIASMVSRLEKPDDILLPVLRWTTLELAVRTGIAAPCTYDQTSSTERQRIAASAFVATYGRLREPSVGNWLYYGKPDD